jgi:hypothetical protein
MYFRPLILESVFLILAVAKVDFRPVPKPDLIVDNLDELIVRPRGKHCPKPLRAFHVVLDEVFTDAPKDIAL